MCKCVHVEKAGVRNHLIDFIPHEVNSFCFMKWKERLSFIISYLIFDTYIYKKKNQKNVSYKKQPKNKKHFNCKRNWKRIKKFFV